MAVLPSRLVLILGVGSMGIAVVRWFCWGILGLRPKIPQLLLPVTSTPNEPGSIIVCVIAGGNKCLTKETKI